MLQWWRGRNPYQAGQAKVLPEGRQVHVKQELEFYHEKKLEVVIDAAEPFDFDELETEANKIVKDILTIASLAELFNAKELLASCMKVLARLEVKLEAEYESRSPRVVLAVLEYCRVEARTKNTKLGVDGSLMVANNVSIQRECFDKISEFLKRNWPRAAHF